MHLEPDEPGHRACHFHGGPWAGETKQVPTEYVAHWISMPRHEGAYQRDEISAGGRQYDWVEN